MGIPQFEIINGKNSLFQWRLLGPDGAIVLTSQGFSSKDDAIVAVRTVKENVQFGERYEMRAENGKCRFNLKSAGHQVVATSDLFEKEEDREKAITIVRSSHEAAVMDKTPR
jgi:hypothetical protein